MSPQTYKIRRIKSPRTRVRGKRYLSKEEAERLLNREHVIEEKIDGKLTTFECPSYPNLTFFAEEMKRTHTIYYKNLPDSLFVVDIYDRKSGRFLPCSERIRCTIATGKLPPPIIKKSTRTSVEELEEMVFTRESAFRTEINPEMKSALKHISEIADVKNLMEGVVVKSTKGDARGKMVNPLFERIIDEIGRWERFSYDNRIVFLSEEEFIKYWEERVEKPLGIKIEDKKKFYQIYASTWRKEPSL